MKLYFKQPNVLWQPERYHYAAEQMMLTRFPGERPEYPEQLPRTLEENSVCFTLSRGAQWATLTAQLCREGQCRTAATRFPAEELDRAEEQVYHSVQHALKMAFYRAALDSGVKKPAWGALTGVKPGKLMARYLTEGKTAEDFARDFDVDADRAALCETTTRHTLAAICRAFVIFDRNILHSFRFFSRFRFRLHTRFRRSFQSSFRPAFRRSFRFRPHSFFRLHFFQYSFDDLRLIYACRQLHAAVFCNFSKIGYCFRVQIAIIHSGPPY